MGGRTVQNGRLLYLNGRRFSIPEAERALSPAGDNESLRLVFDLPAQPDETDLSGCAPALLLRRADGTAYTLSLIHI